LGWIGRGFVYWWRERVYVSVHPDSRFHPGRLATSQPRGPELHTRMLYRIVFFAGGSFVVWDSVRLFLLHRG
jgi:hypothetical protein